MPTLTRIVDIHGSANPSAGVVTRLYTAPSNGRMVASKIAICNHGLAGTFRVWVGKAVETENDAKTRRFWDVALGANSVQEIVGGDCFRNLGWISVSASTNNFSFQIHGEETTIT